MRRILHIIDSLGYNGPAKQLLVLGRGLLQQGYEVHVAALDGRGALAGDYHKAGMATCELNRRWPCDPLAYFKLHRLTSKLRPNIVHTWDFDAGVYGRIAARAAGVRNLVVGQHRIDPSRSGPQWTVERRLAKHTTHFVTSSPHVRDWCAKHCLPAYKFTVIRPGVPPAPASDVARDELLRELQMPADARLIGVVGRLTPEKRVKDLIWAADLLRVLHDNLRLVIIGDGPQRPQLEQYARLASDLDHVRFLGQRNDVWRIMPHLDVLWNADERRSPSIAILEAMAAGVPVVASDTPFNRELVAEGETGFLITHCTRSGRADRARRTDRIFSNPKLATRLAAASHQRVAKLFAAECMVRQYTQFYESEASEC
jgi:glycosyltransferase involved in cell wall biosynthesis